jgi:hypothetical protein
MLTIKKRNLNQGAAIEEDLPETILFAEMADLGDRAGGGGQLSGNLLEQLLDLRTDTGRGAGAL